jgi:hypothetical protein
VQVAESMEALRMKCENNLNCHREMGNCLDTVAASFASNGLGGNASVALVLKHKRELS